MKEYRHKVQYYETDKMGITHHSNYIRWFEESRVDFLEQAGFGFDKMEELGIASPVLGVRAVYKKSTRFPETVSIAVRLARFSGIKFSLSYEVKNEAGELCCTGESDHCFLTADGRPCRVKNSFPAVYTLMEELLEKGE